MIEKGYLPIIQRTLDGRYFHINEKCFVWVNGAAVEIPPALFREATKHEELLTWDMELTK